MADPSVELCRKGGEGEVRSSLREAGLISPTFWMGPGAEPREGELLGEHTQ